MELKIVHLISNKRNMRRKIKLMIGKIDPDVNTFLWVFSEKLYSTLFNPQIEGSRVVFQIFKFKHPFHTQNFKRFETDTVNFKTSKICFFYFHIWDDPISWPNLVTPAIYSRPNEPMSTHSWWPFQCDISIFENQNLSRKLH